MTNPEAPIRKSLRLQKLEAEIEGKKHSWKAYLKSMLAKEEIRKQSVRDEIMKAR